MDQAPKTLEDISKEIIDIIDTVEEMVRQKVFDVKYN